MIFVDSSVWVDYFNGRSSAETNYLDELLGKDGITLDDTCKYSVPALDAAGVDCFDISQGSIMHSMEGINIPLYYPRGCFIHNAEAVKKVTDKPVIGVGRIVDLDV